MLLKKISKPLTTVAVLALPLLLASCGTSSGTHSDTKTSGEAAQVKPQKKPNILFILSDDHRWDLIGKYHPIIKTPNLDKLANQGTVFKNAFVTTPICATSRISILTSLTERTHDFTFRRPATGLAESNSAYPKVLKDNGYNTAFVGKYEIKLSGPDESRFDFFKPLLQAKTVEYKGQELPQTYYIAELAKEFIQQNQGGEKPWVMAVNFWDPHAHDRDQELQYHYPEEFESYYQDITIPPAKFSQDDTFAKLPQFLQESIGHVRWKYRFGTEAIYQKMVKRHYRAISGVDKAIGKIYQELEKQGMADNTVIIYAGDNGYSMNERQLAGKWFGWEEDLRIPLIIYDPRNAKTKGKEHNEIALNIDIAPTILALADVKAPESYQGSSLTPILNGESPDTWRQEFFFEHMYQPKRVSIPPTVGIRTQQWKYVDFYKHDFQQLYDLVNDPEEQHNLAYSAQHQATLKELSQRTDQYIAKYEAQRSEEVKQRKSYINQRN
ncbi:acetylglucosamine-6-sulfatase [Saccharobesus litoralis]|uniref:Acetylglucosamine-6-sulfatase n=2 Tax=Saccharobesus litoralis TaxID=2172099 RepID=A0A2S0VXM5_9ALTE|nr:acetylglucosamine-6-sulfatase [Saccharobesus litoralis]